MNFRKFARLLVSSTEDAKSAIIASGLPRARSVKLAFALRDLYYELWTTEPAKTQNVAQVLEILSSVFPEKKIYALSNWVAGASALTVGDIPHAVTNLDIAYQTFKECGDDHLAAQTRISKLHALAMLGSYDDAIKCGKSALKVFSKHGDSLAIGKIHHNLGNIYDRRGFYEKAKYHQLLAKKHFLAVNDLRQLSQIEHSLAITYSALNDFRKSEDFYKKTLDRARKLKMLATEAEIESTLGNHSLYRGRFAEALRYLEQSRQKYDRLKMPSQSVMAEVEIADAYLELNLVQEAYEIYQRIVGELSGLKMRAEEARARMNYARAAMLLGLHEIAGRELAASETLYKAEKNRPGIALTKIIATQLALLKGKRRSALSNIKQANSFLSKLPTGKFHPLANWLYGETQRVNGEFEAAREKFLGIVAGSARHGNPQIFQSALVSLGKTNLQLGNEKEAINNFRKAIGLIETMRQPLPGEEFKMAFFADKLVPYRELTNIYLRQGQISNAFKLLERSRSRALTDNLGSTQKAKTSVNKATARITAEIDDLREELNWFYKRIDDASTNETSRLKKELDKRERRINALMRQTRSHERGSGIAGIQLHLETLRQKLGDDRVLLEFTEYDSRISAFVVSKTDVKCVASFADMREAIGLTEGLQFQFGAMRYGTAKLASHAEQLKYRADTYLGKLYELLIAPLQKFIGEKHLVIVPHGGMHSIPFHALQSEGKYLIEQREVSYAPSATVLQHCLSLPNRKLKKTLLIGYGDEKIPHVKREIANIRQLFKGNLALTGRNARVAEFEKNASDYDIIHMACHGQFRLDNPMFSNLKLADGAITARDIAELRIKAGLVTLSACETGLNRIFAGDELLGLTRGFLAAGAGSLLMSLWTVNDKAATELMTDFYANLLKGKGLSTALRLSQCNLIMRDAHPYFWSPFFLVGRW